jgi:hypothetical protein
LLQKFGCVRVDSYRSEHLFFSACTIFEFALDLIGGDGDFDNFIFLQQF